jgi:protein involved in polysaccharide export with SLBB domain/Flp pilus assembly protein TadD
MKKVLSLCLAVSAAAVCPSSSIVSAAPAEKRLEREARAASATRAVAGQGQSLVRGREHRRAAEAAFELGVKYARAGRHREAVSAFREAVLYDPGHADAHFSLGHALYDLGRWAEAVESLKLAASLNPKDTEALNYLGASYFRQGLYEQAIEAYKRALLVKPDLADVRYNIANAFFKLGRYEPAVLYYREAGYLRPKSAELFNDMGVAYAEWGRHAEAAEAFKRAASHNSNDAYAQNNLALAYHLGGQRQEAAKALERALRSAPRDESIQHNAALLSANPAASGAAVGDRVSLRAGDRVGGQASGRWLGRSDLIRGVHAAGSADAEAETETASATSAEAPAPTPAGLPAPTPAPTPAATPLATPVATPTPTPVATPEATPRAAQVINDPAPLAARVATETAAATPPAPDFSEPAPGAPRVGKTGDNAPGDEAGAAPEEGGPPSANGGAAAPAANAAEPAAAPAPTSVYRVGVGDVLDIRLLDDRTRNSTLFTVQPGGLLEYAPLGDPVVVAGKTTDEIADHIKAELRRRALRDDPQVSVGVREYVSHTVIVSGLVGEPGAKALRREAVPLYVVVADAQPLPEAKRALITSDSGGRRLEVSLDDQAAMNTLVRPGDVVNLLGKEQQFYFIGGKVEAPGQKDFHSGITLTQAILAAGGALHASKTALVTRQTADGLLSVVEHNLKKIMSGGAPDPRLQPGDRIEVIR